MDAPIPVPAEAGHIPNDPGFAQRFDQLRDACVAGSGRAALGKLRALHVDADSFIETLKRGLFSAPLAWNDEQKAAGRWIALQHHLLARSARRVAELLAGDRGAEPAHKALATALAMHHMAEAMKCEMADDPRGARHFGFLNALMREARASGFELLPVALQVQGIEEHCPVESLFFRALLLARSGGVLSNQQVEILDAWYWLWVPALRGTGEKPVGTSLRADLDSHRGLRRPADGDAAGGLYLPLLPLERAFRAILAQFQNGVIVPAVGHASRFRMEEHMVVLDMARRTLRGMRREPVARAVRRASDVSAELHVGIAEILSRGFKAAAPASAPIQLVAFEGSGTAPPGRETHNPMAGIYDIARRSVQVVDVSASGLGLEGGLAECGEIAVGDIVAIRLAPGGPLELGKVARRAFPADDGRVVIGVQRAPGAAARRVVIGVRQLSPAIQQLRVTPAAAGTATRQELMLFVPGEDTTGRQDAFLVGESALERNPGFAVDVGDQTFSLRLNRVRDRGRGWVLAGFEIFGMRKRDPMEAAA